MSSTLVFGGTFDPVHRGHIESVSQVAGLLSDVDSFLVPCQIPAHRSTPAAEPQDRLEMLKLALTERERMHVDDRELRREGTSYTFDTLLAYRNELGPKGSVLFLMGYDSWLTLPTWHRWDELTNLAHLVVISRPGVKLDPPEALSRWSEPREVSDVRSLESSAFGKLCFLSLDQIDVSATSIRGKIARGDSILGDVDPLVLNYILEHNLYAANPGRDAAEQQLEK